MADRKPVMMGNWKMNLNHLEAIALVQKLAFSLSDKDLDEVEVVVLPPFTDIRSVQTLIDGEKYRLGFGGQNVSQHPSGAFTGEIAASMLAKLGCSYTCVGHSERRQYFDETDEIVNTKARIAMENSVTPVICVGESLPIRQEGQAVAYTLAQVAGSTAGLVSDLGDRLTIAYEPVWAIGTGEVATPEDAQEVCGAIRDFLRSEHGSEAADSARILYGGSVKSTNVAGIMAMPDIDGGLVGGASLDPDEFATICKFPQHPAV